MHARSDLITVGKEAKAKGVGKVAGEVISEMCSEY